MINKILLLHKTYKKHLIIYIIFVFFTFALLTLTIFMKTFDTLEVSGIMVCDGECLINSTIPYNKVDVLARDDLKIKYDNSLYEITEVIFEEPYMNGEVPFQDVMIKSDLDCTDRIINFRILYNKQRIIKKVKDLLLER